MSLSFAILIWLQSTHINTTNLQYVHPHYKMQRIPPLENEGDQIIRQINLQNSQIQSLYCPSMKITVKQGNNGGSLEGMLAFERDRKFRMTQESFFGSEMDIGSNETHFWFWSKRMKPSALCYARHENIMKTGLRMPFNPMWMMEILGMKDIVIREGFVTKHQRYWAVVEERMSTEQKVVNKVTLIDPEKMTVVGHYIYDLSGEILVSAEVKKFHEYNGPNFSVLVPKEIDITWFEEEVIMKWKMNEPQINHKVDPRLWVMPNKENEMELGITLYRSFLQQSPDDAFAQSLVGP